MCNRKSDVAVGRGKEKVAALKTPGLSQEEGREQLNKDRPRAKDEAGLGFQTVIRL